MHRKTVIGPLWQTVHAAVWSAGLVLVFRRGEGADLNYAAYVTAGIIVWNFMLASVTGGAGVLNRSAGVILNLTTPVSFHVFRQVAQNLARLGFQVPVYLFVLAGSPELLHPGMLLVIPGLLLVAITSVWVVLLLGLVGARFGDTQQVLMAAMRFLFFSTPIFWVPGNNEFRQLIATYNPFAHYLEVVRAPLLGGAADTTTWVVVLSITFSGLILTLVLFNRYRRWLVFWL